MNLQGMTAVGYKALVERYNLAALPYYRSSYVVQTGGRKVYQEGELTVYVYDKSYLPQNSDVFSHLEFALKHEGMNVQILLMLFEKISEDDLICYIQATPTGKYVRIIWYLYELFTKKTLPIDDCPYGTYAVLLDPEEYYTGLPITSTRHRVKDNFLGNPQFCPVVRRSEMLTTYEETDFAQKIQKILTAFDAALIDRANNYLFTKETMSSYAIERERPDKKRLARFIDLLKKAFQMDLLTKQELIKIQNAIVDERFADKDYRVTQNYVGEQKDFYDHHIHYISPKPEDVEGLMSGLLLCMDRMLKSNLPPIVVAAVTSFGFVFIHPFEDGNGRIHRFLIHYLLARTKFTPESTVFPVSATMLQNIKVYTDVLEDFSKSLLEKIGEYELSDDGVLTVCGDTKQYYQCIDFTKQVEYLFQCVKQTIYGAFQEELSYLLSYDKAKKEIQNVVDMPDNKIDLLIRLVKQGNGMLSEKKRVDHFSMLTDEEIIMMCSIIQENMKKNMRLLTEG